MKAGFGPLWVLTANEPGTNIATVAVTGSRGLDFN